MLLDNITYGEKMTKGPASSDACRSRYAEASGKVRDAVTGCIRLSAEAMRALERETRALAWRCVGTRLARMRCHEMQSGAVAVALG